MLKINTTATVLDPVYVEDI